VNNVVGGPLPKPQGFGAFFGELARNQYDDGVRFGYDQARAAVLRWAKANDVSLDVLTTLGQALDDAEPLAYQRGNGILKWPHFGNYIWPHFGVVMGV